MDKLRQKALCYVFSKRCRKLVDVKEIEGKYVCRCEEPDRYGVYYEKIFAKTEDLNLAVAEAVKTLEWLVAGNEFPT